MNVSIEGNIGCGKTTFINYIKDHTGYLAIEEPIKSWTDFRGLNILNEFYKNPSKYGYHLQSHIFQIQSRLHQLKPRIIERSISSSRYCFTELLRQNDQLSEFEYTFLEAQYQEIVQEVDIPGLIIYLRTDISTLKDNIVKRSRQGEEKITKEYLVQLERCHERWLIEREFQESRPVIVIDQAKYYNKLQELINKIAPYLEGTSVLRKGVILYL